MKELKVNCGPDSKKVDEYVDLDDEADYNAAAPNYITKGGDGYTMLKENIFDVESGPLDSEVFEKYLAEKTPLEAEDIDHENKRSTIIISGEGESKARFSDTEGEAEGESGGEAEEEAPEEETAEEEAPEEETEAPEEESPEEEADEVVGKTNIMLDGGKPGRSRETNLGNLVTDAMMSVSF